MCKTGLFCFNFNICVMFLFSLHCIALAAIISYPITLRLDYLGGCKIKKIFKCSTEIV